MKKAHDLGEDREPCTGISDSPSQSANLPPFRVLNFKPCAFGSKRGTFDVEFCNGAVLVGGEFYDPDDGEAFVAPASIRNRYTGRYERTVQWADELAAAILKAVLANA